ncbi:hypothetical protein MMC10_006617 [Thelotrema lepadinum]|nr:hypothetical protein [Thelotrema lepadinum]
MDVPVKSNKDEKDFAAMDDHVFRLLAHAQDVLGKNAGEKSSVLALKTTPNRSDKSSTGQSKSTPILEQLHSGKLVDHRTADAAQSIRSVHEKLYLGRGKKKSQATAGPDWFDLPKTNMTKELKRDLQLLHMRNVLDPKRHFKKENKKVTSPEFSQLGTIVEGPTEFFCARVPRKQRTRTLTAELLADQSVKNRFKSKYGELQGLKSASKKTSSKSRRHKKRR